VLLLLLIGCAGLITGLALLYVRSRRHPLAPGQRPPLATIICLWEFLASSVALAGQFVTVYYNSSTMIAGIEIVHAHYSLTAAVEATLVSLLGIAAAVALWRMSRLAFYIFAAKYSLALVASVLFDLYRSAHLATQSSAMRTSVYLYQAIAFGISAAILWYVQKITKPQTPIHPPPQPSAIPA
jgi:hypothetical protein